MNNYTYLCRTKPEVGEVSLPVWCQIQISNLILTFQTLNEIVTLIRLQVFSFLLEKNREGNPRGIVSIQVCQGHKSMEPGGALCVLRVPVVAIGLSQGMRLEPVAENLYDDGKRQEDNSPVVTLRFLCLICCLHISGSTVFLRKDTNKFRPVVKNTGKSQDKVFVSDQRERKMPRYEYRAGLLSCFVKRDAEPSEGECSLGEFVAEILQCLTHPLALTGSEGGSLAVHHIAVHFLHKPSPALAEIGLGDITQADSLGDAAYLVTGNQFLGRHGGSLFHVLTDLADAVKKLFRRYPLRLGSLVDHVVEILLGLLVFDVVCYSFHSYVFFVNSLSYQRQESGYCQYSDWYSRNSHRAFNMAISVLSAVISRFALERLHPWMNSASAITSNASPTKDVDCGFFFILTNVSSTPQRYEENGKNTYLMQKNRKFYAKSLDVSRIFPIFAPSNLRSGAETAGITSSLFCIHTLLENNRITTPCRESGNRPGASASKSLTARSVVSVCQNLEDYGIKELCDSRERCAACVFLPAAGVQQVQEDDVAPGVGAGRLDRLHLLPPHVGDVRPLRGVRQSHRVPYGDRQPAARPDGSLPGDDVVARQEVGERLHPHRAHQRTAPERTAARHRLPWMCGTGVIFN